MKFTIIHGRTAHAVDGAVAGDRAELKIGDDEYSLPVHRYDDGSFHFIHNGRRYNCLFRKTGREIHISVDGALSLVTIERTGTKVTVDEHNLLAPMPGIIRKVMVKPGDTVAAGDRLVIIEAMKMEHPIVAPRPGMVRDVLYRENEQVKKDDVIVQLDFDE